MITDGRCPSCNGIILTDACYLVKHCQQFVKVVEEIEKRRKEKKEVIRLADYFVLRQLSEKERNCKINRDLKTEFENEYTLLNGNDNE